MTNKENQQALQSTKSTLSGAITELGSAVFQYGNRAGDNFTSTKELIADYVGRLYGKRMRILVLRMKENPPAPPAIPETTPPKKSEPIPADWRRYDKATEHHLKLMEEYHVDKGKTFIIVLAQCSTLMKHKIEGTDTHEKMEDTDDVVGLLTLIQNLSHGNTTTQNSFWVTAKHYKKVGTIRQNRNESLPNYYKRWMTMVDVLEGHFGPMIPTKLTTSGIDDSQAQERFKACLFLHSVDLKQCGSAIEKLNNQCLTGQDNYPTSVVAMVNLLTHRIDGAQFSTHNNNNDNNKQSNNNNDDSSDKTGVFQSKPKSFVQKPSFHQNQERKSLSQTQTNESDGTEGVTSFSGAPEQRRKIVAWWMNDDED